MLLTQGVPYIDREQLGLSYISCPSLLRFRGPRHDNINLYISLYIVDHYLNIDLLELWSIVCQINIEKESDVWFGRYSQWLAQLADLPRQPFGLVFSLHSMQTSWGLLTIMGLKLQQTVPRYRLQSSYMVASQVRCGNNSLIPCRAMAAEEHCGRN